MNRFLCVLAFTAMAFGLKAQSTITGTVKDADTGETLPGVTVYTNSSRSGTATNLDGQYTLKSTAADDSLTFSFIGYLSQTVAMNGRTSIDIGIKVDQQKLDEVVVVGYGTQRKSDLTGSITTVKAEEITKVPTTNAMNALQGKVAGLQITAPTGEPGVSPIVRLRGVGTFNDASVLYVVDGVFTNDINFLSPSDIATMTVLKDASATALYGSRGANGVIVVTTKNGSGLRNGKPQFQFDLSYGLQTLPNKIDLLNAQEFAEVLNVITPNSFNRTDNLPNTNWQDEIFRDVAPMQQIHFSASGSSDRSDYYFGLGYFKQEGIIPKSEFERVTMKLNNTYRFNEQIRVGTNMTVTPTRNQGSPSVVANAYRAWPTDGPFAVRDNPRSDFVQVRGGGNPLATIFYTNNETNSVNSLGNIFGEVDFLKGFTARTSFGIESGYGNFVSYSPVFAVGDSPQANPVDDLNNNRNFFFNWLWENTLSYKKQIDRHRFDVLVGYTAQQNKNDFLNASVSDLIDSDPDLWYIPSGDAETIQVANGAGTSSLASTLFRINYTYDDRYLFTGNFRRDGSSKFGPNNRYGNFASFALGWNILNEDFMANASSKIDLLKIRGSYGFVGNEKINGNDQFTLVSLGQNGVFGPDETLVSGASYGRIGNPNLKWEETEQLNIGLDFGFLSNRLQGSLEYYNKTTDDILVGIFSPGQIGNGAFVTTTVNAAKVRNQGLEFQMTWRDDFDNGISYQVGVLGSTVDNEVLEMGRETGSGSVIPSGSLGNGQLVTRTQVGSSVGEFYGYQVIGVLQNVGEVDNSPTLAGQQPGDLKFADTNGDGILNADDQVALGSYIPDFIYGFNANIGYKGISLGLDFYGQAGNEIYNGKNAVRPDQYNYEAQVADYWRGDGTSNSEPRPTAGGVNYQPSSYFVQDGSFFRLRTATLAYQIPDRWAEKIRVQRLSVYVRGTNLFTLSDFTGYSPEIASGNVLASGIDLGTYPITSIYTLGLNLTF